MEPQVFLLAQGYVCSSRATYLHNTYIFIMFIHTIVIGIEDYWPHIYVANYHTGAVECHGYIKLPVAAFMAYENTYSN